jgi:hypothetical protein
MPRYKLVNGVKVQFTVKEENLRDAEEAQALIDKENQKQIEQDAINKKESGKQKLLNLGLSEEEIKALIGIT